jgi:hypothetical protein
MQLTLSMIPDLVHTLVGILISFIVTLRDMKTVNLSYNEARCTVKIDSLVERLYQATIGANETVTAISIPFGSRYETATLFEHQTFIFDGQEILCTPELYISRMFETYCKNRGVEAKAQFDFQSSRNPQTQFHVERR